MKDTVDMPKIASGTLVKLGSCEICGEPVMVAKCVVDICPKPITTCSRECGENAAENRKAERQCCF